MTTKERLRALFGMQQGRRSRGFFAIFLTIGIGLIIIAVILGVGAYVITEIEVMTPDQVDSNANATSNYGQNITNKTLNAMNTMGSWLNIIVIIAIAVAIIGLIFTFAGAGEVGRGRGGASRGGRSRL